MKRTYILIITLTAFIQCSKDKNEKPGIDLGKGLLAVFKMNNEFNDSTGNILITDYTSNGIKAVADRKGNAKSAMYFDEGHMYAIVDELPAKPITISCWVRPKNNTNDNFFLKSGGSAFGFSQQGASIGFVISVPGTNSAMTSFDTGWVHLVGTYDGKDIRTYINGQLMATMNHPGTPNKTNQIKLGSFQSPWWKGTIDEVRFYNRVLSTEEIKLLSEL